MFRDFSVHCRGHGSPWASCGLAILILDFFHALEEFVERDAVHKALMSLLTQDVKGTLCYLIIW
jgi:hypothetical protein